MLICHKLVSNAGAVLQAFQMSNVHATLAVSIMPASWEVVCQWTPHPVLFITSGFSNTITRQRRITTTAVARRSCRTHENSMLAEQIIIIFYGFLFFFALCIWYCFNCIVQKNSYYYTGNIFLYNYLLQLHQLILLSPVGCFTPARGKTQH